MTSATRTVPPRAADTLMRLVQARSGISLGDDKLYLLESRLGPVIRRHGIASLDAAAERVRAGIGTEALCAEIVDAMTTNETFFFRDEKPFRHVRDVALPAILKARPAGQKLRIWSAACSSGQELASLAMILLDMKPLLGGREVELIGTDLSPTQVARAEAGLYSHFEVQRGLPVQMLVKYFEKENGSWRLRSAVRDLMRFRCWNLLDDPTSLGRFDIVFCRNVLIYFDQSTKTEVLRRIGQRMAPDGYLYLGGAETVLGLAVPFETRLGEAVCRPIPG